VEPPVGIQKRFLHQVLGRFRFTAETVGETVEQIDMLSIQLIKGFRRW
jgi:hypothetical protein